MSLLPFNNSYIGERTDIVNLLPKGIQTVLDVGCSTGVLGRQIKQRFEAEIIGIEYDPQMAEEAKAHLDKVIVQDAENIDLLSIFKSERFDCIIYADLLEHLKDPWTLLRNSTQLLNSNGCVIASIPNVRHYSTIYSLIFKGYWPYRDRGVHDKTHLRFFTLSNIHDLFSQAGLTIEHINRKFRIIENIHPWNRFSKHFVFILPKDFLTFQYLILARKSFPKQ